MKYKSFISKLKKRLGEDLDISSDTWGVNGRR